MARNKFDVDEKLKSEINFSQIKRLWSYIVKFKKSLYLAIVLMLINSVLNLLPPYLTAMVIDVCLPNKDFNLLYMLAGGIVVSEILIWINTGARAKVINKVGMGLVRDLRYDVYNHMQYLPLSYFDSRPHGKILIRVVNYINAIAHLFSDGIVDIVANLFTIVVIIVFMLFMDVKLTLVCLLAIPIFIIFILLLKSKHRKAWQTLSAKQSNLTAYISENISGMKVTQSFAREEKNYETFDSLCRENKKYWMKARYIEFAIPVTVNILSVVTVLAIYLIGASRIGTHTLTLGVLIAFASYVTRFWTPISTLANYYNQVVTCSAYIERIFETLDEPLVITDLEDATDLPEMKGNVERIGKPVRPFTPAFIPEKNRKKDEKKLDKLLFMLYYIRVVRRNLNMLL